MHLTRRDFIRLGGAALAGIALRPLPLADRIRSHHSLGRVATGSAWVREEPSQRAAIVRRLRIDDTVAVFEEVEAEGINPHNPIWFRLIDGYIYSSSVQPVERALNRPLQDIPPGGLLGEVSVPYTDARYSPSPRASRSYRLRYSSAYRIAEAVVGEDHRIWYRVHESQSPGSRRYVRAEHVRPLYPEDLEPISPGAWDKRIEISLADQKLEAFESDECVLTSHASCGVGGSLATPRGEHAVTFKSPSRHMVGADYNLPGVSFCTYFWGSIAIHGTYWHNDYGRPRSHGCVNVPPEVAKWIFRWTVPTCPYEEDTLHTDGEGTTVVVY